MPIEIIHQLGHNDCWNYASHNEDGVGAGFIQSPLHKTYNQIQELNDQILKKSYFDPQFFKPDDCSEKLLSYSFYPGNFGDVFLPDNFISTYSEQCALECFRFQHSLNFNKIIIPTIHFSGLPLDLPEKLNNLFVKPFLRQSNSFSPHNPILLQLIVNNQMIINHEYSAQLLNWITGIRGIDGVYLIADVSPRNKQIKNIDFLYYYLQFIDSLRQNDLYVLLGYQNTESILLSLANPNAITIGTYENRRIFDISNFDKSSTPAPRQPNPRIYLSQMLQWVEVNYIGAMQRSLGDLSFIDESKYTDKVKEFQPSHNWHFSQPVLYKHYLTVFSKQMNAISSLPQNERFELLMEIFNKALRLNSKMSSIQFDENSDVSHIDKWITVAKQFAEVKGWK